MRRFAKGEFAITTGSRAPLVNNGHLVIVREVCGPMPAQGLEFGYLVERVDGEPFALTCLPGTPMPGRGGRLAYAGQHHLRPLGGPRRARARHRYTRATPPTGADSHANDLPPAVRPAVVDLHLPAG